MNSLRGAFARLSKIIGTGLGGLDLKRAGGRSFRVPLTFERLPATDDRKTKVVLSSKEGRVEPVR